MSVAPEATVSRALMDFARWGNVPDADLDDALAALSLLVADRDRQEDYYDKATDTIVELELEAVKAEGELAECRAILRRVAHEAPDHFAFKSSARAAMGLGA